MRFLGPAFHVIVQVLALAILTSCGGGDGDGSGGVAGDVGSSTSSSATLQAMGAPTISNLSFSPIDSYASAAPMIFNGRFDFTDADADVSNMTMTVTGANGATVNTFTQPIPSAAGLTAGVIQGGVLTLIMNAGNYTFQVFLSDATGLRSNVLSQPIRIAQAP